MGRHVLAADEVRVAGANNWMMLHQGDRVVGHASHWQVSWSELGTGSALFVWSEQTDARPLLMADNVDLARWIVAELVADDSRFKDASEILAAELMVANDAPNSLVVRASGGDRTIEASWLRLQRPLWGYTELDPGDTHTHSACYVPAAAARLVVDGAASQGEAVAEDWFGSASSSAFLAAAEVWLRRVED